MASQPGAECPIHSYILPTLTPDVASNIPVIFNHGYNHRNARAVAFSTFRMAFKAHGYWDIYWDISNFTI